MISKKRDRQVDRAAWAIVELINSRPMSPRQDEIANIIDTLVASPLSHAQGLSASLNCAELDREYGPVISMVRS